jgi:hypothetical protein
MLGAVCEGAELHVQQADNFSWFGFPDDTVPSSRFGGGGGVIRQRKNPPPKPRWNGKEVEQAKKDLCAMIPSLGVPRAVAEAKMHVFGEDTKVLICSLAGGRIGPGVTEKDSDESATAQNEVVASAAQFECDEASDPGDERKLVRDCDWKRSGDKLDRYLRDGWISVDLQNIYRVIEPSESGVPGYGLLVRNEVESLTDRDSNENLGHVPSLSPLNLLRLQDALAGSTVERKNSFQESISDELRHQEAFQVFSKLVEDPGVVKKKMLGSKALQRARNWKPLNDPVGVYQQPSDSHSHLEEGDHNIDGSSVKID